MPRFETVPVNEALVKTASRQQAEILKEYLAYIEQLKRGEAGKLQAAEGETVKAVSRRLGTAAKLSGKDLVIKRTGDEVYFWVKERGTRRGRPRRVASASS